MIKKRILAFLVVAVGALAGYFVYATEVKHTDSPYAFSLGLDLSGGTHLVYRADVSAVDPSDVDDAMSSLREVVERRVDGFAISEIKVQTQEAGFGANKEQRIIIDMPGVTDIEQAKAIIGKTPILEFKTERPEGPEKDKLMKELEALIARAQAGEDLSGIIPPDPYYVESGLTGRYLKRANVDFPPTGNGSLPTPVVTLEFDKEGAELFEEITTANIGKTVAIYLDGTMISSPVVQGAISGGQAVISGNFTAEEAKQVARDLNFGALPLPIESVSTQSIGPSLGIEAAHAGAYAGFVGFVILSVLLILWYRLPGLVAVISLAIYIAFMCALFKLIPITLTAAGIAGFIISLGLAVDGNILISERLKEELRRGRTVGDAIRVGFDRAWTSIRDSNTSSIITAVILYWFGSSLVKGFALTLGLGALMSMFSAVTVSRMILMAMNARDTKFMRFLFRSGFTN